MEIAKYSEGFVTTQKQIAEDNLVCPACELKRLHAPEDWEHHPYAHHGYQKGLGWSHPDLVPGAVSLGGGGAAPAGGGNGD